MRSRSLSRAITLLSAAALATSVSLAWGAQSPPTVLKLPAPVCAHTIDPTLCPFCDPSRIDRLGMCKEHGVAEALCVKCKPYLKAAFIAANDWCKEHDTPESQCAVCNPEVVKQAEQRMHSAGAELRWQHEPSKSCSTSKTPITLSSASVASAIGLEMGEVQQAPLVRAVERNAEIAYNANRYARLASRASGVVTEIKFDLGEDVKKGDVLAVVESADLGSSKSDLLLALETLKLWQANAERERALVTKGVGVEREAMEAETKAAESRIAANRARQQLRNLGLSKEQVERVESDSDTSSSLELLAPFDGKVVERNAVVGETAGSGAPLLALADTRTMWALLDLADADLASVKVGQTTTVIVDGLPTRSFTGKLTWISTQADQKTRTLKARVELDNGDGMLRANMFGRARITAGGSSLAITVPKDAVQWEGCCNIAFVCDGSSGTTFKPVRLLLAFDAGDRYEVAEGLKPGDRIVTRGSYILKNELLKNAVGAGCCEND